MSDYLFTSSTLTRSQLSAPLHKIYTGIAPSIQIYQGAWGSLAVTQSHYKGFLPYENDQHLMVVIGGPVLYFRDNDFLVAEDSHDATLAIYHRWITEKKIQWDEDLSGPFTIFLLDKAQGTVKVITDLMAFIPVYTCTKNASLYLGTHVDALASLAQETSHLDQISLADFVLNDAVTYPYTAYKNLRQLPPSAEIFYSSKNKPPIETTYWQASEINPYKNIQDAAKALKEGISGYVDRVTYKMTTVAQFISAGEDSRSLCGLLPQRLQREAFIFLDAMNREGRIAKRVADIYGANFNVGYRKTSHYSDILPEACKLVGSGHQFFHAHSLGFDKTYKLANYPAVFGGYLSDSLLKSAYARKLKTVGHIPFFPQPHLKGETRTKPVSSAIIDEATLSELTKRRTKRFKAIRLERPITAHEWFVLRPATMRVTIPNFYSTRRLFCSYEPFMCKEAVKISAAVPTSWKLNRRLFNQAMKPYLKQSKWLLHADGRLPYFSWWANIPLQASIFTYRFIARKIGLTKVNEGPWGDWQVTVKSESWAKAAETYGEENGHLSFIKKDFPIKELLLSEKLPIIQRVNLLQTAYLIAKNNPSKGC